MSTMKEKLRIGLLLDGDEVPAWAYKILARLKESASAEIVLKIMNKPEEVKAPRGNFLQRVWKNRHSFFYILYSKFDQKKYKLEYDSFVMKDISTFIPADTIIVEPVRTKFSDTFPDEDIRKIEAYKVDIMIRLGFRILRGKILNTATYGIWSYHHGDNLVNRGGPAGFWEVMEQWDETGVILQILNEDLDNGLVLHKAYSPTYKRSVLENRNNYFWKSAEILPDKVDELHRLGKEEFFRRHQHLNDHPTFYSNRLYVEPTNKEMLSGMWRLLKKKIAWQYRNFLYLDQWILLFHLGKSNVPAMSFFRFKRIMPPKDRFWADPHVLFRDGKYYIYIEELLYATNKGHISLIEMDAKGKYGTPRKIIEKNYHLSYPFVFEDEGRLFMIPESMENKTIELYECTGFPDKWELHSVLMEGVKAVDTTLVKKDGTYYLFTTIQRTAESPDHDDLCIFHAPSLDAKEWTPHPRNPVVTDTKFGRQAGKFFTLNGKLYRPAQNCSKHYGYGMNIQHVVRLDKEEYEEVNIASILPNWERDLISTHSFVHDDKLTVIDALIRRSKFK